MSTLTPTHQIFPEERHPEVATQRGQEGPDTRVLLKEASGPSNKVAEGPNTENPMRV